MRSGTPLKNVICINVVYLTINNTQNGILTALWAGTDWRSSLSSLHYRLMATVFCLGYCILHKQDGAEHVIFSLLAEVKSTLLEVFVVPDQLQVAKLSVIILAEGMLVSSRLEDLSLLIPMKQFMRLLFVPEHSNSVALDRRAAEAQGDALY